MPEQQEFCLAMMMTAGTEVEVCRPHSAELQLHETERKRGVHLMTALAGVKLKEDQSTTFNVRSIIHLFLDLLVQRRDRSWGSWRKW